MISKRKLLDHLDWIDLLIIVSVGLALSYGYFFAVHIPSTALRLETHISILRGDANAVNLYRVLMPFLAEPVHQVLRLIIDDPRAFRYTFLLVDSATLCFSLTMIYLWLRQWFLREAAILGILIIGSTAQIGLRDHAYRPDSLIEPGLFALACLLIVKERYRWLILVIILSVLNRPSGGLIILSLIPFLLRPVAWFREGKRPFRAQILWSAAYGLTWGTTTLILLLWRGPIIPTTVVTQINLLAFFDEKVILNNLLFLGAFWLFALMGLQAAADDFKPLLWLVPPYLILMLAAWVVSNIWYEVRVYMTLYPLLLPLILWYLWPSQALDIGQAAIEAPTTGPAQSPAGR